MKASSPALLRTSKRRPGRRSAWRTDLQRHGQLYLLVVPAVLSVLVFNYGPLFGLLIAFLDYSPFRGIFGSEWIGWNNFQEAVRNPFFANALRNSLILGGLKLAVGYPAAIILALLLNEVRLRWFRNLVQTASILPFFISWVVAGAMFRGLLAPDGALNGLSGSLLGLPPHAFLSDPQSFRWVLVFQDTWKYAGYFAVLYLAAMSSIDRATYEAAEIDGASRWQQARFITLPGISNTMVTLLVILVGYLVSGGFEQVYVMYNVSVYSSADILETFSLRLGLQQSNYGLATAVGLFQGLISLTLVGLAHLISKRVRGQGLF